jgi:glycine/D-amino acid oxidase-like deaminating enzyme
MRTFSKDHRFVIGPDSRLSGLHWAAGLGGHGITTGPAVGRLAAEWLVTGASSREFADAFTPERLLEAAAV